MRHTLQTKLVVALIGAAGLATAASAQFATKTEPKSSSTTTVIVTNDDGAYEIKIQDGKLYKVVVDGEKVDPELCELDEEGGFVVIHRDGDPIVVDIPAMSAGFGVTTPLAVTNSRLAFPGQTRFKATAPTPIEWADVPGVADAPGQVFFNDGPPRVMVGITHDDVNDKLRKKFDLDEGEGIYVIEVRKGLPASKAGIKSGDIIIEAGGEFVDERSVLVEVLEEKEPGDKLEVIVLREGDEGDIIKKKLRVKLAEYDRMALGGNVLRGFVARPDAPEGQFEFWGDDEEFVFEGQEFEPFAEFDFEFPEEIAELSPEVREEVERALEIARDQAAEAKIRALTIRNGRLQELELQQQDIARAAEQIREHALLYREHAQQTQRDMHERHAHEIEKLHEHMEHLHNEQMHLHELNIAEVEKLRDHGLAHSLTIEDAEKLREHGITLDLNIDDDLERLLKLELKLDELGDNQKLIRVHPEGRAFLIEREAAQRERERVDRRDQSDNQFFELRNERDELRDRNRELERRVDDLERRLEMLMRKLEKSE